MERSTLKFIFAGIVVLLILASAYLYVAYEDSKKKLPYYVQNPTTHKIYQASKPDKTVGKFSFIDQQGKTVTAADLENTVYVADYFFVTCPGICKEMSSQLERVYQTFEQNPQVKIISHTAKPEEDSVSQLLSYALQHGVKDHHKWIFVTGDKEALYHTARQQYMIVDDQGDGGEDDFIHTERFALVDKHQYIRGYYDGTDSLEVSQMIEDIRSLLEEK